jgi:hypothetical protein
MVAHEIDVSWAPTHHEWQQFMTGSNSWVESYLTIVPSSTRMPRWTHRGRPKHYPIVHPWSKVRYCPTHQHTKLLSLGIPYVPYAPAHKCLFIRTQSTQTLINPGRGYHLGAVNLWSRQLSSFPSIILQLKHSINYSSSRYSIHEPGYTKP